MTIKNFLKNPLNVLISVLCLFIIVYFGILIFNEVRPKSYNEQVMHCLELGSNERAQACINILHK